ncbi:Oidioi.mRNA.OKI2018_I69.chr1.g539.t1.cds [Oikopleura dioica]|uniref:Oidioi.mRNA.OKI2018_I69.chr1.g539.t1.cds n=1 Tax=Oikopleura dioica TaxID=34765 RepID=A0ABN7SKN6_OIKDI|nr:Oidioi.mRNA.OKI2018_I69.chr1.g539.t1.cds [Oikopleura dioica]
MKKNICPEQTKCIPDDSSAGYICKCLDVVFYGLEGKVEKTKTITMENFSGNSTDPLCLPVQSSTRKPRKTLRINLKSTAENFGGLEKPCPYGVLYEFFKLEVGKEAIKRPTRRPDAIDKILERQDKLLKGLMGDIDRGWRRRCGPRCSGDICSLEEIRAYHDQSIRLIKSQNQIQRALIKFIEERVSSDDPFLCGEFRDRYLQKQRRIFLKLDRVTSKRPL